MQRPYFIEYRLDDIAHLRGRRQLRRAHSEEVRPPAHRPRHRPHRRLRHRQQHQPRRRHRRARPNRQQSPGPPLRALDRDRRRLQERSARLLRQAGGAEAFPVRAEPAGLRAGQACRPLDPLGHARHRPQRVEAAHRRGQRSVRLRPRGPRPSPSTSSTPSPTFAASRQPLPRQHRRHRRPPGLHRLQRRHQRRRSGSRRHAPQPRQRHRRRHGEGARELGRLPQARHRRPQELRRACATLPSSPPTTTTAPSSSAETPPPTSSTASSSPTSRPTARRWAPPPAPRAPTPPATSRASCPTCSASPTTPSQTTFDGKSLLGAYAIDDEGVPAQSVDIVVNGKLENFLIGREPVKDFPASNGHGRAAPAQAPHSHSGVILIKADTAAVRRRLNKRLLAMAKEQRQRCLRRRDAGRRTRPASALPRPPRRHPPTRSRSRLRRARQPQPALGHRRRRRRSLRLELARRHSPDHHRPQPALRRHRRKARHRRAAEAPLLPAARAAVKKISIGRE